MDYISEDIFSGNFFEGDALLKFGFTKKGTSFFYETDILNGNFCVKIKILDGKKFSATVIDKNLDEPYELHLVPTINGNLVDELRREYTELLLKISKKCCKNFAFKTLQAKESANFIRDKFGVELEFLWEKFPDCAITRRPDNRKWFAAFLTCEKSKLGLQGDGIVEILDVRVEPSFIDKIDAKKYFQAYHMNKKRWMTLIFDFGVGQSEINSLIKKSFELALKR